MAAAAIQHSSKVIDWKTSALALFAPEFKFCQDVETEKAAARPPHSKKGSSIY